MFGKSITLFKIFGFAVRIDLSWLIILALVIWSLAGGVFPQRYPELNWPVHLAMGLAAAFGLFASIVFHELCHSLVARRYGLPMRGITLFIFGGLAEMSDEPPSPKAEAVMAIAGPLSSLSVAVVCGGLGLLGARIGWPDTVVGVLGWVALINIVLAAFNLIPGFPLDGGRVLRAALWRWKGDLREGTRLASKVGAGFGAAVAVLGFLELLFLQPIGGLWLILIGLFIRGAAKQAYQQVLVREVLHGQEVRRFMNDSPVTVPPSASIRELVEDYIYKYHFKLFPVVEGDRLAGCVTTQQVKDVPREQWDDRTVEQLTHACSRENTVSPEDDAMDALARMNRTQASRLMVVEGDRLVGILSLKDLLQFLSLKLELEPARREGLGGKIAPDS